MIFVFLKDHQKCLFLKKLWLLIYPYWVPYLQKMFLTLYCIMSQNGQTHFKNLAFTD